MGYEVSDEQLNVIFTRFKKLADKKKTITSSDLEALVLNRGQKDAGGWQLFEPCGQCGRGIPNTAYVKMSRDGQEVEEVAIGTGPLDASFKAINRITQMDVGLESFSLNAVTDGEDAIGEAVVKVHYGSGLYTGTGISTDIIESSIRAYVNGINKIAAVERQKGNRRHEHDNDTKILAHHAGLSEVRPGQLIRAKLDMVLGNDITSPVAINEFEKAGFDQVFDKSRVVMIMDHFAPNKDIKAATQCKQCRTFARRFDLENYYDVGRMGIEHALVPERA